MGEPRRLRDFQALQSDDNVSIVVPDLEGFHLRRAAESAIDDVLCPVVAITDAAIDFLADRIEHRGSIREHVEDGDYGCGCEGPGWWCEEGDGEVQHWQYTWLRTDVQRAEDLLYPEAP